MQEHPVAGRLAAGPYTAAGGIPAGKSLPPIMTVADQQQARGVAAAYPLVQAGLRRSSIRQWRMTKQAAGFLQPTLNTDGER